MVIGTQIAGNSFWYDHGVELLGVIVALLGVKVTLLGAMATLAGFWLSFHNIRKTNEKIKEDERKRDEKEERDEQEKNEKTLKLIDLATYNERMSIQQWSYFFIKEKNVTTQEKYPILVSTYINRNTENKRAFIVGEIANKYKFADLEDELINFLEIIKGNLNNNHINLSLESLDIVNRKISNLNEAIDKNKRFKDIGEVINIISADLEMRVESQIEIDKQYKAYENFSKLLEKIAKGLLD